MSFNLFSNKINYMYMQTLNSRLRLNVVITTHFKDNLHFGLHAETINIFRISNKLST
jgi:hypothetical protein